MPRRTVTHQEDQILRILLRQFCQKYICAVRIAIRHRKKEVFSRQWLYCSKSIAIFPNMVAWNGGTPSLWTPAVLGLVDSSEPCFILEHQSDISFWLAVFGIQYTGFHFFEASQASSFAAFGCLDRGIFFFHPCRFSTLYTYMCPVSLPHSASNASLISRAVTCSPALI